MTLAPYLGFESLRPGLDAAAAAGRGVFVLARTSNPEGAGVQLARPPGAGAPTVAQAVVDAAAAENAGAAPGSVGVVVGGTADHGLDLSALNGPVLVPGLGAQGAGPGGRRRALRRDGRTGAPGRGPVGAGRRAGPAGAARCSPGAERPAHGRGREPHAVTSGGRAGRRRRDTPDGAERVGSLADRTVVAPTGRPGEPSGDRCRHHR